MVYRKFNNSRSESHPFYVYIKCAEFDVISADGSRWGGAPKDSIIVTKEEFDVVEKSYNDNKNYKAGDEVVIIEYSPFKKRYGVIKELTPPRELSIGAGVLLEDGRWFGKNSVFGKNVIHLK